MTQGCSSVSFLFLACKDNKNIASTKISSIKNIGFNFVLNLFIRIFALGINKNLLAYEKTVFYDYVACNDGCSAEFYRLRW